HAPTTRLAPPTHRSTTDISGEPPIEADACAVRASRRPSPATSVAPRSAEPASGDGVRRRFAGVFGGGWRGDSGASLGAAPGGAAVVRTRRTASDRYAAWGSSRWRTA